MSQAGMFGTGGGGGGTLSTLTGNTGGAVSPDGASNINLLGSGIVTVTGNPGTNTLTISISGGGFTWNTVTGTTQALAINTGYIANNAGMVTFTLPASSSVGDIIEITGINNATGWRVAQNSGQTIYMSTIATTTGTGGSLTSSATRDSIRMVCVVANTDWNVISSIGNITYV